jgi:hypothetical protein
VHFRVFELLRPDDCLTSIETEGTGPEVRDGSDEAVRTLHDYKRQRKARAVPRKPSTGLKKLLTAGASPSRYSTPSRGPRNAANPPEQEKASMEYSVS